MGVFDNFSLFIFITSKKHRLALKVGAHRVKSSSFEKLIHLERHYFLGVARSILHCNKREDDL